MTSAEKKERKKTRKKIQRIGQSASIFDVRSIEFSKQFIKCHLRAKRRVQSKIFDNLFSQKKKKRRKKWDSMFVRENLANDRRRTKKYTHIIGRTARISNHDANETREMRKKTTKSSAWHFYEPRPKKKWFN